MTPGRAGRLAWALWLLAFGLLAAGVAIAAPALHAASEELAFSLVFGAVGALLFGPVGAFLAARLPRNPIGWLLAGYGVVMAYFWFTIAYVGEVLDLAIRRPDALPGADWVAWPSPWSGIPATAWCSCCSCCSPTGGCRRPAGARWPGPGRPSTPSWHCSRPSRRR